ncbi:2-amino-4-hydroxy-6-hydroxymethyldihydropteridine diphosphokinase [Komagataeibacter rhaeticus]|uniref:2-amino-4-hydroxy-6-hydroxymethyldihydropteridine pyrophosphokinase n=1 Tax=Komagataeibacter rhaeticus TaxID=215221 RepID=A0A181C871_9PROT|nr:2-amino-4-hydroxy-6-hydroxymethyldihydropteridine diphosphokinase [Komagataeibacter rhaeticus]ATU73495.1 2-amino-4-hydroxy-6-hydroxymethyldihydropteridine diphosphokinase [Komagataeibacter xylinus]EGG75906.1 Folic acid synthesis protein fol1 [Gluconacetobacter sp. SXCC-1]KDU95396.1 2-amino-4-hydroxy-6-hydroxymethyldihydropteridine pyrophosphokinase [Komagataeibacter rhaeticus AF1]MBL7239929.1 2-amino-4-hydroxy-6-hydroxymethyldihydropteridine diphosphokinase [Komagataeibacter rhaeticus]PYD54
MTMPQYAAPADDITIAVGANLPRESGETAAMTCRWAVRQLARLPGLRVAAVSRWYESAPVPPSGQPPYVNGVVRLSGRVDPAWLLARLHAIEAEAGRRRTVRNAARPLDLDIITMGDLVRAAPDPVLPHPRATARAFVLLPLRDVMPEWRDPVSGQGLDAFLPGVAGQEIAPMADAD